MPPNERVGINVEAKFHADTSQAKQAFDEFTRASTQAAQRVQGALGDRDSASSRAKQLLKEQLGDNFSYIGQQKEINKILHEQRQHYRELSDTLYRQERAVKSLGGEEEKEAMKRIRRLREDKREMAGLVHALESDKAVGLASEGRPAAGMLNGMSMQSALNGGLIAAGAGALGRMAMAHPLLAGIALAAGTAHAIDKFGSSASAYSENLDVSFANTGRRTGMGRNLRRVYEPTTGRVSQEFQNIGFAGEDIAAMAEAYGMPGGPGALLAQGRFARAFGFGENPSMISGLGRRATQLGLAEPSQQGQFWALMTAAVEKGLKNGMDASETLRSLLGMTEQVAAHTGVVSREYLAGLAGIQSSLSAGPSRFFKGERGAHEMSAIMEGLQRPQGIAQQRFIMNAIKGHFGGQTPSADQLGLGGGEAMAYSQMVETDKLDFIMQNLPALMGSNPGLLTGLVQFMGKGASPQLQSLMAGGLFPGMSAAKRAKAHAAFSGILSQRGVAGSKIGKMGFLELLSEAFNIAPQESSRISQGLLGDTDLTEVEQLRLLDKMIEESTSAAASEGSRGARGTIKGGKSSFTDSMARFLGGDFLKSLRESIKREGEEGYDLPGEQESRAEAEAEFRRLHGGAKGYKQSYGGESLSVNPIQVSGSIELIGADGVNMGQLPATAIGLLIQKAIQEQSGTPRASAPTRTRLLAPRAI